MSRTRLAAALAGLCALAGTALIPTGAATAATVPAAKPAVAAAHTATNVRNACGAAAPGHARCFAQVRTDVHGGKGLRPHPAAAAPAGYGPAELRSAYKLPRTGGAGQTVAVVDAGDDPTAEADLAVYRATYGLPPCTTANGCFHKVNQNGGDTPLPADAGWSTEIALDLDMVSAACPDCRLLLVEGDASLDALGTAENTAVRLGATEVSNSFGAPEQNSVSTFAAAFHHPGVAITASSGDSGYGIPQIPAVLPGVIGVGGTTLTASSGTARGWTESAWRGAGSGCSAWYDKPAWQHDPNCPGRMSSDVSAVADPQTGVAVYDTDSGSGWMEVGGTSASSPLIAGVIALAGHPERFSDASYFYTHAAALNDVVGGNNGIADDCGGDYQCNALTGYDGPTGNGTPNGLGAF